MADTWHTGTRCLYVPATCKDKSACKAAALFASVSLSVLGGVAQRLGYVM